MLPVPSTMANPHPLTPPTVSGRNLKSISRIFFSINCLSLFVNCRSQLLLDRLGRYLKLFVSTDIPFSHEFTSQFGLANLLLAKNTQKLSRKPSRRVSVQLNDPRLMKTIINIIILYFENITQTDDFPLSRVAVDHNSVWLCFRHLIERAGNEEGSHYGCPLLHRGRR